MSATRIALRESFRRWPTSLAFAGILGAAVAVAGAWLAIAYPILGGRLPFPNSDRLVAFHGVTWTTMEDLRGSSVEAMAAWLPRTWGLQTEVHGHVELVLSQQVTGEFFDVLGVKPYLGDPLTRNNEQPGDQMKVWLTHDAWRRLLGGTPAALHRTVWINATPFEIAGILPAVFDFPYAGQSADIYIPLNRQDYWGARGAGALDAVARLQPGVPPSQFQAELNSRSNAQHFAVTRLAVFLLGTRLQILQWLLAAVAILMTIAMANASGVWLAQWIRRQRDARIKIALGASTPRLLLEESQRALVLGGAAALLGLAGAQALLYALRISTVAGQEVKRFELWQKAALSPLVALCLVALAIGVALASAILPILVNSGRSSTRVRFTLAVVQLTMTGTLAYSGIMIWRNIETLLHADRGFRTEQILTSGIGIPEAKYNTDEKMIRFHQRAIDELSKIPGVTQSAGGVSLPVSSARTRFLLDDDNAPRDQQSFARIGVASPALLQLLQIPVQRGRGFGASDRWETPHVALVNQAFVRQYLPDGNALRHRIRMSFYNGFAAKPYAEHAIVGVIGDTLNRDLALTAEPQIILSSDQMAFEGFLYFVRSGLPAAALQNQVRDAIWKVDPELQGVTLKPLSERVEQSLVSRQVLASLLSLFGVMAILIVAFGLASSLTATFAEMRRELAIRAALGATPVRLAYAATRWAIASVAASCVLSLPLCQFVDRFDATSWLLSTAVIGTLGFCAALIPAARCASIDPARTLKAD